MADIHEGANHDVISSSDASVLVLFSVPFMLHTVACIVFHTVSPSRNIITMDSQAVLSLAHFLLPSGPGTSLKHPTDLIALYTHAIQVAVNFRLDPPTSDLQSEARDTSGEGDDDDAVSESATAVGDDNANDSSSQQFPTSLGITLEHALQSRLPQGWNDRGEDSYTFSYRHTQSSLGFVVKVGKIGSRVSVMGMVEVSRSVVTPPFRWLTRNRTENHIRSQSCFRNMFRRILYPGLERMSRRRVSGLSRMASMLTSKRRKAVLREETLIPDQTTGAGCASRKGDYHQAGTGRHNSRHSRPVST